MRLDFKALRFTAGSEALFVLLIAALVAGCFWLITRVYSHGVLATLVTALLISWISMQVWALLLEHRLLWPPGQQFAGFIWGDLLGLPGIAIALCLMREHHSGDTLADKPWWRAVWMVVGLALGIVFHAMEAGGTFYSASQIHSPTKLWHDLFVFPVFIYFIVSQLPLVWESRWGIRSLAHTRPLGWATLALLLVSLLFWGFLTLVYDGGHMKRKAHLNYDWERLRPSTAISAR